MSITVAHYPTCSADYPEKPEGEAPRLIYTQDIDDGETVYTCVDCGAFVVTTAKEPTNTKIVLHHVGELTQQEQDDLRFLISDALHDFQVARRGEYVERRYPSQDEQFKRTKRETVERRCALANKLKGAAMHITVQSGE